MIVLNKADVPEARELAEMVKPDLEARGLEVFIVSAVAHTGLRELTFAMARHVDRGPRRASRSVVAAADRAAARRRSTTAASWSSARTPPTARSSASSASAPPAGCARPTSPTTRPSATSPTGSARPASRRRCSRPVPSPAPRSSSAAPTTPSSSTGSRPCPPAPSCSPAPAARTCGWTDLHRPTREEKRADYADRRAARDRGARGARGRAPRRPLGRRGPGGRRGGAAARGRLRTATAGSGRCVDAAGGPAARCTRLRPCPARHRHALTAASRLVVKVGSQLADHGVRAGWTWTRLHAARRRPGRPAAPAAPRWCWCPPAPSRPASGRWGWPAVPGTWPPSRPRPASGRAPCSRLQRGVRRPRPHGRPGAAHRRRRDPAHRTTPTRGAPSTGCSTSGVVPVVNENDTVATARDPRSATTTGWPRWSPTSSTPTRCCCSPTSTRCTTGRPAGPGTTRVPLVRRPGDLDDVRIGGTGSRRRHRRHGDQGRGRGHRHGRGHHDRADLDRAVPRGAGRRTTSARSSPPPARGGPPGCSGWRTPRRRAGGCVLDQGAVPRSSTGASRCCRRASSAVEGSFDDGDPVDLCDPAGRPVGRGLVNYDSAELPGLLGRTTHDLARELGPRLRARGRPPRRPGAAVSDVHVRPMGAADAPAVLRIYQQGIDDGAATFEVAAPSWEQFDAGRLPDHRFVAVDGDRAQVRRLGRGLGRVRAPGVPGRGRALRLRRPARPRPGRRRRPAAGPGPVHRGGRDLDDPVGRSSPATRPARGCTSASASGSSAAASGSPGGGQWQDTVLLERRSRVVG